MLHHVRVHEAMHQGIISVRSDTTLRAVARVMAGHRVHALAVTGEVGDRPIGIVSALDIVRAAAADAGRTAGELAATEVLTISSAARLDRAAQLMSDHELSHLVVTDAASGHPSGILSTLDLVAIYGG